jgi:glutathione S-transferase
MTPVLYLGNRNYSSWSMRAWLALRWAGIAFEERFIPLGGQGYGKSRIADVVAVSPSGRVPALHADGVVIVDSLAICEWAHERAPLAALWPSDRVRRALARSAACEMHAGFAALRRDLSMNIRRTLDATPDLPEDTRADLDRVFELWAQHRTQFAGDGPFLFGARSIADALFAPVATRLRTYAMLTPPAAQRYCDTLLTDPAVQEWERGAKTETWTIEQTDALYR